MRAIDRKLLRDFWSLRAQVVTTAILVICGVSLLVSTWSAYNSLKDARDTYYPDYAFGDVFCDLKRAPMDMVRKVAAIPNVN